MKKIAMIVAFAMAGVSMSNAEDFKPDAGFTAPFNGKDFTGWKIAPTGMKDKAGESLSGKTESATKRFTIVDGTIVIDPKVKGDITIYTEAKFEGDAHIKFEFKPDDKCNNDMYFRGMKFDLKTPDVKNMKVGEWNQFEIIVTGDMAEFKNNGESLKKVKAKPEATNFGLRAELGGVQYRKLQIKAK